MRVRVHAVALVVLIAALFSPAAVNAPTSCRNTLAQPSCVSTAVAAARSCVAIGSISCLEGVLDSFISCLGAR